MPIHSGNCDLFRSVVDCYLHGILPRSAEEYLLLYHPTYCEECRAYLQEIGMIAPEEGSPPNEVAGTSNSRFPSPPDCEVSGLASLHRSNRNPDTRASGARSHDDLRGKREVDASRRRMSRFATLLRMVESLTFPEDVADGDRAEINQCAQQAQPDDAGVDGDKSRYTDLPVSPVDLTCPEASNLLGDLEEGKALGSTESDQLLAHVLVYPTCRDVLSRASAAAHCVDG